MKNRKTQTKIAGSRVPATLIAGVMVAIAWLGAGVSSAESAEMPSAADAQHASATPLVIDIDRPQEAGPPPPPPGPGFGGRD